MANIGVGAEWIGTRAGGLETYESNLIRALAATDPVNRYNVYTLHRDAFADLSKLNSNFTVRYLGIQSRWILIPLALPYELARRPVDLFHATSVPPVYCPAKMVLTVHDLAFRRFPEVYPSLVRYRLSKLISLGIRKALRIIAVSESTKRDLIDLFKVEERKIAVVYEGVNKNYRPCDNKDTLHGVLAKYGITGRYILYVGRLHVRKNLVRLVQAFANARKRIDRDLKLVLVGRNLYDAAPIFHAVANLGLDNAVISLGHIHDDDLPCIYAGAVLFVYPSLFEGFGLPPLEAMACGVPVVTSDCSSLPEVVGDAAALVDPYDVNDIADKICEMLANAQLRKTFVTRGRLRAQRFTWEAAAEQTQRVYADALATK